MKAQTRFILNLFSEQPISGSTFFYLLKGKRTIATLFGGLMSNHLSLLHLLPKLQQKTYDQTIRELKSQKLLIENERQLSLTTAGREILEQTASTALNLNYYDGRIKPNSHQFRQQLRLATQVVAEYGHFNRQYLPLDIPSKEQVAVKHWFKKVKSNTMMQEFQQEWYFIFKQLTPKLQPIVAAQLIGNGQIPLTTSQLAQAMDWSIFEVTLAIIDGFAQISQLVQTNLATLPLMGELLSPLTGSIISTSAQLTYQLFLNGKSIEEISQLRHLKESTVKEHLLEVAIFDANFPVKTLYSTKLLQQLPLAMDGNQSFDQVVSQLPELSFFQYRLYQIKRGPSL